jgi:hypothetical protein
MSHNLTMPLPRVSVPIRQLMWHEAMPPCDIYNSHAGLQTLCHNPRLQIIRPASVSPPRLDHLETPNKPITTICHTKSPFVSGDFLADTSSVRNPHNQWGGDGAYASLLFDRGYTNKAYFIA